MAIITARIEHLARHVADKPGNPREATGYGTGTVYPARSTGS